MQATKVMIKKVKIVIKIIQSTKVTNTTTVQNNIKITFTKAIYKKKDLNEMPRQSQPIRKMGVVYN